MVVSLLVILKRLVSASSSFFAVEQNWVFIFALNPSRTILCFILVVLDSLDNFIFFEEGQTLVKDMTDAMRQSRVLDILISVSPFNLPSHSAFV